MKSYKTQKWWKAHEKFVKSIKEVPFFKNDGKPLGSWKLFETRDAAWNAAWNAARNAAWDVARNAARNAAWDVARNAARNAAWDAAWNAAWDAALFTRVMNICSGLKLELKFKTHAKARWQVWKKGYGLLCDINGVFYVYKRP